VRGRSFSPSASAFWHSRQRYSNSELLSESTSLWITRAYRRRVALPQLAQLTYVSEMAVLRVPRTSSCMADTDLSLYVLNKLDAKMSHMQQMRQDGTSAQEYMSGPFTEPDMIDYGTHHIKLQVRLTFSCRYATMFLYSSLCCWLSFCKASFVMLMRVSLLSI
jgi:hypothetical protein